MLLLCFFFASSSFVLVRYDASAAAAAATTTTTTTANTTGTGAAGVGVEAGGSVLSSLVQDKNENKWRLTLYPQGKGVARNKCVASSSASSSSSAAAAPQSSACTLAHAQPRTPTHAHTRCLRAHATHALSFFTNEHVNKWVCNPWMNE